MHDGILIVLGTAIFGGTLGATLFQKLHFPQVIGYIVIGLVIGESGLQWVGREEVAQLEYMNLFALAIIGCLVGGELHRDTVKQYGRQFLAIVLGEGVGAFLLTGTAATIVVYLVIGNWMAATAAGVVFGAIASATDPASTLDVLWENRARGVLTTTLIAIVALDDALAMALYAFGTSIAQMLTGQSVSVAAELIKISIELGGACALGALAGIVNKALFRWLHQPEKALALTVGLILLVIGICQLAHMDVIIATMAFGAVLINVAPLRSKNLFTTVRSFSTPIYVLFFVLVGARLAVTQMPGWLWGLVAVYVVCRSVGKMAGAYFGAKISGADPVVRKYTGLGLFAQGGIAVGLSIMAAQHLGDIPVGPDMMLGDLIIFTVTATTLVVQLTGPYLIRMAVRLAGEVGRNVTEEDVVESLRVDEVMDATLETIGENTPVTTVFEKFSDEEYMQLPVVDNDNKVVGIVTLDGLREIFGNQDTWEWLVARDVAQDLPETAAAGDSLSDAIQAMREMGVEHMLVLKGGEEGRFAGMLDSRKTKRVLHKLLLERQKVTAAA
ncbi:MAG: cation:proton antiporter [Candidatus Hydrogenedentes bacterium]|nr:cation:proton antiporter [Candidatus Hydrogenedentota bacterium]